jgi:hypothetical protein
MLISQNKLTEEELAISILLPAMWSFDSTSNKTDPSSHTETLSFLTSEKYSSAKRYSSSELLDK